MEKGINIFDLILKSRKQDLNDRIDNYGREGFSYGDVKNIANFKQLDKGCETWIEGHSFPIRGAFQPDRVEAVRQFKHAIPVISRSFKKHKFSTALFVFLNWKDILEFLHHGMIKACYSNPENYSQPVREVYRVMSGRGIHITMARDILCAILENDTAYRYRFQDIVSNLDQPFFKNYPRYETKTLIELFEKREHGGNFKEISILKIIINFLPMKAFKEIVGDLKLSEILLSKEDKYWTDIGYLEYDFGGEEYIKRIVKYGQKKIIL